MLRKINSVICLALLGFVLGYGLPAVAASESEEYFADAKKYLAEGKRREAVIQLKNAIKTDPTNAPARVLLGTLYLGSGEIGGARKELGRAGRLGAVKDEWLVGLGQAMLMENDFDAILNEIKPDQSMSQERHATALAIRGNAYLGLNDAGNASQAYEEALGIQPGNPLARLGKARILLRENKLEEAAEQFSEVLRDNPEHVATRLARADLYRSLKKLPEAVADYTTALEKQPHNIRAYIGRALANLTQGNLEEGEKDITTLKKRAKQVPVVSYLGGLLAFLQKDYDKSSEELQLVLRSAPENLQAQMLYGIVSYARGQYTIADDYLTRVANRAGNNLQLTKLLSASRIKLKNYRGAIEVLEPMVESAETPDVQSLALLGTAYLMAGENAKGTELMSKAVEIDPEQAVLRTQLAAGRIALGDAEGAVSDLEAAVNLGQDLIQADVLLVLGYLNQKQHDKAIQAAMDLEQRMPDSPVPPNLTGLAYMAQGKFEDAQKKYQEALKIDPAFTVANMNLARMALLKKDEATARTYFEKVIKQSPGHEGALLALAGLAANAGRSQEALDRLNEANRANPKSLRPILMLSEMHLKNNEPLKAINLLAGVDAKAARNPAVLRLRGMAHLQSGEFSSARASFEELVERRPKVVEGWFQLARSQAASGDMNASRDSFAKAIELDSEHKLPLLWLGLGELELREKRYQAALDHALEMQKHFPGNAMAYEIEAAAHRGMGNVQKTLKAVEKAVRAEGNSKRINLFAHTLAASGNTPKAVYMLEEWLENNQADGVSWTTLGMMYQQMGQDEKALSAYDQSIKLSGGNPVVLNNMAWLYMDENPQRAAELARQAYDIAPERAEIVDTYGWVLFKQGKHKEALNILQQALVLSPRNPEIALHVADALHHLGRNNEAKPLLERILQDHPHTAFAAPARELLKKVGK